MTDSTAQKQLLIVYHSQSGQTEQMAYAAYRGAQEEEGVQTRILRAWDAGVEDLLSADGLIIGSPENFGYMAGAIKDFFDRTYYPVLEHALNLPYALLISAGNDGSGAIRQIDRILSGYPMRKVAEPVWAKGLLTEQHLSDSHELGLTLAAGLAFGIF